MAKAQQKEADHYSFHMLRPQYKMFEVDSRLRYFKPHASKVERTFAEEISGSLDRGSGSKFIDPKFFYDAVGSALFEEICSVPEYYLTRTEIALLERIADEIGALVAADELGIRRDGADHGDGAATSGDDDAPRAGGGSSSGGGGKSSGRLRLVELGSGSSVKTRIILDVLHRVQSTTEYFPIDISDILTQSSEQLLADYPKLRITGIIDTYEGGLEFLKEYGGGRSLIMFLGSSYGNLAPRDGAAFLGRVRSAMKPGDLFLMGVDMAKDRGVLESAYNDSAGVTSRFNLNVLSRINSELDADFDLGNFAHRARYNPSEQRVEMHLESLCEQTVTVSKPGLELRLGHGELIHTENSYKYEPGQVRSMLDSAGFRTVSQWTDPDGYFMLVLAEAPAP